MKCIFEQISQNNFRLIKENQLDQSMISEYEGLLKNLKEKCKNIQSNFVKSYNYWMDIIRRGQPELKNQIILVLTDGKTIPFYNKIKKLEDQLNTHSLDTIIENCANNIMHDMLEWARKNNIIRS